MSDPVVELVLWDMGCRSICEGQASVGIVVERDECGHFGGDSSHDCANLFMNVVQEGIGVAGPSAMLSDGDGVHSIELHGHGSSSPEGVGGDLGWCDAAFFKVQDSDSIFEAGVDVHCHDMTGPALVVVGGYGSGLVLGVCHDVCYSAG